MSRSVSHAGIDVVVGAITAVAAEKGIDDSQLEEYISTAQRTPGSSLRRAVAAQTSSYAEDLARANVNRPVLRIAYVLDPSEILTLKKKYPDFTIEISGSYVHDHALAAACRAADRELLRKRLPVGARYADIGGDFEYNILNSETPVHSHCPSVDIKDETRYVQRMRRLAGRVADSSLDKAVRERIAGFLSRPSEWLCRKKVQDCDHEAPYLLSTHVYDATLEDLATGMVRARAHLLSGCMNFSPDMMESPVGELPTVGGWYQIENVGSETRIYYGFVGSSSYAYEHDFAELRRFAHDSVVCVGTSAFAYTVVEVRGDTLFYTMQPLDPRGFVRDSPRETYTLSRAPVAVVDGFEYTGRESMGASGALRPKQYIYPLDAWLSMLKQAQVLQSSNKFSCEELARRLRQLQATTHFNSVKVAGIASISAADVPMFIAHVAFAACLAVAMSRAETEGVTKGALRERAARDEGVLTSLSAAMAAYYNMPWEEGAVGGVRGYVMQLVRRLRAWSVGSEIPMISWFADYGERRASVDRYPAAFKASQPPGVDVRSHDEAHAEAMARVMAVKDDAFAEVIMSAIVDASETPTQADVDLLASIRERRAAVLAAEESAESAAIQDRMDDPDSSYDGPLPRSVDAVAGVDTLTPRVALQGREARAAFRRLGYQCEDSDVVEQMVPVGEDYASAAQMEAMDEFCRYSEKADQNIKDEARKGWDTMFGVDRPDIDKLRFHYRGEHNADFYYVTNGEFLHDSARGMPCAQLHYTACYVGTEDEVCRVGTVRHTSGRASSSGAKQARSHDFVLEGKCAKFTGYVYVNDEMQVYNGPQIREGVRHAMSLPFHAARFVSHEGVFGCGKTHTVVTTSRHDALIVASGRDNTDETRRRRVRFDRESKDKMSTHRSMKKPPVYVRTTDSALMRLPPGPVSELHVDEARNMHAGKYIALVRLLKPSVVFVHGDSRQLPFISRVHGFVLRHNNYDIVDWRVNHYITHRSPADVTMVLSQFYGGKIRTDRDVVCSLSERADVTVDSIRFDPAKQYLTLYQDEKKYLMKEFKNVHTVGEVQGEAYDHVVLVRMQTKHQKLFEDEAQVIVAMSRHKKTFEYINPQRHEKDKVSQLIQLAGLNLHRAAEFCDTSTAGQAILL